VDPLWRSLLQGMSLLTQVGLTVVVSTGLGLLLGRWIDGLLGTGLIATLVGTALGVAAGGYSAFRLIQGTIKDDDGNG